MRLNIFSTSPESEIVTGETDQIKIASYLSRQRSGATKQASKEKVDVHWLILGDGILKPWIEEQVQNRGLGDIVHFLGKCPLDDVPYYLVRADVLLASLKKDRLFEITVPGKLQSCLASGRPIVGSFDGEAAAIINEAGAGFTAPAGDAAGLADAVSKMARLSPERRDQMGQAGRDYFLTHFERESLFSKLEAVMSDELNQRSS